MRASQKNAASITVTRSLEIMETNSLYWPLALFFLCCQTFLHATFWFLLPFLLPSFSCPSLCISCFLPLFISALCGSMFRLSLSSFVLLFISVLFSCADLRSGNDIRSRNVITQFSVIEASLPRRSCFHAI